MSPTGGDSPGDSEYSSTKSPRQNTPRQKSPHQKSPNQPKNPLHISSQIQRFGHLFLLLSLNFIQSVSSTSSRSANSRDVILEFTDEQLKNEIFRLENTNDQPEKSITSTTASKKTSFNNLVSRDIIAPFFHNASITVENEKVFFCGNPGFLRVFSDFSFFYDFMRCFAIIYDFYDF